MPTNFSHSEHSKNMHINAPGRKYADSYWFIITRQDDKFVYQSIEKYNNVKHKPRNKDKILPTLLLPDLEKSKRYEKLQICLAKQAIQRFDESIKLEGKSYHWETELLPLSCNNEEPVKVIGHSFYIDNSLDNNIDNNDTHTATHTTMKLDNALHYDLLQNINRQMETSIRPLKISTHLLCKADQLNTRLYLSELVKSSIHELETTLMDIRTLNLLQKPDEAIREKRFSLPMIMADFEMANQVLLSQRSITLHLFTKNMKSIEIIANQQHIEHFFNKLLKLIIQWSHASVISLWSNILTDNQGQQTLNVKISNNKLHLPEGMSVTDIENILNGHFNHFVITGFLPLLDILLCQQLLQSLKAGISLDQHNSYYIFNISIPVNINTL